MTAKEWGHDELATDLAAHLWAGNNYMTWCNFSPDGAGGSRPDVYAIRRFNYAQREIITYECKVSKSDLMSDLTSGKWQKYLKYSAAVTFATPAGLCTKDDIPNGCGLIQRGDNVWRTVKRPTLQRFELTMVQMLVLLNAHPSYRRNRDVTPERWQIEQANKFAAQQAYKAIGKRIGVELAKILQEKIGTEDIVNGRAEKYKAAHEQAASEVRKLWDLLAEAVGMPPGSDQWGIQTAVSKIRKRLTEDGERMAMDRLVRDFSEAVERFRIPIDGATNGRG